MSDLVIELFINENLYDDPNSYCVEEDPSSIRVELDEDEIQDYYDQGRIIVLKDYKNQKTLEFNILESVKKSYNIGENISTNPDAIGVLGYCDFINIPDESIKNIVLHFRRRNDLNNQTNFIEESLRLLKTGGQISRREGKKKVILFVKKEGLLQDYQTKKFYGPGEDKKISKYL